MALEPILAEYARIAEEIVHNLQQLEIMEIVDIIIVNCEVVETKEIEIRQCEDRR